MPSLLKRLENYLEENPKQYNKSCIERVRKLVKCETENPHKSKPYRFLGGIEDFTVYFHLHPEWKRYSVRDAQRDKKTGALAFYTAFNKFINEQTKETKKRRKLIQKIFKPKQKDWSYLDTLNDWKREFNNHQEWQGYSPIDAQNDKKTGANAFYSALITWIVKQTNSIKDRRNLREYIFKSKTKSWLYFNKLNDWKREFNNHQEWQGYSLRDAQKDKETGANAFYQTFKKWVKNQTNNKEERRRLMQEIFKSKQRNWTGFITLEDWKKEFNRHLEWIGYSTTDAKNDKKTRAGAFYAAFKEFINKQTTDKEERKRLIREIFKPINKVKIKTPNQLIEILNTEPKARYAVENAVKLSDPNQIDITIADVLAVVWDGRIKRDNLIDMLQRPSLAGYLGKFVKNDGKKLPDFIEAAEALLPYDKNNAIRDLIKRRIETWLYDESLNAIPSKKDISTIIQKVEEQIGVLK